MSLERYEKYVGFGVECLSDIPINFEVVRFKDITKKIQDGTHFTPNYKESGVHFLSVNDITRKEFNLSKSKFISIEDHHLLIKRCKPRKGDILLSKNGTIGIPYLIDFEQEISIYVSLCLIRLKSEVLNRYFFYTLLSSFMHEQYKINAKTNSVSNLHLDKLANFFCLIPIYSEQKVIAEYLDNKIGILDKKVALLEDKMLRYQELRKSLINETVCRGLNKNVELRDSGIKWIGDIPSHWEVKRIKSFAKAIKGRNLDVFDTKFDKSLPLLTLEYLRNDKVMFPAFAYSFNKILQVHSYDYIVVWDGAGVGDILKGKEGFLSSTIAKIDIDKRKYVPTYFYHLRDNLEYILKKMPTGMGIPHLNPNIFMNTHCPVPPLQEQKEIAEYLDAKTGKIDSIVSNINIQINLLNELRKTLINDLVTGQIKIVK